MFFLGVMKTLNSPINACFLVGSFPNVMKIYRSVPVFKKRSHNKVSSYRPISLIPVLSKLFETIIFAQLYDHHETHQLLAPGQFGFRERKKPQNIHIQTHHKQKQT